MTAKKRIKKRGRKKDVQNKIIENIYFNPKHHASFGGKNKLKTALKGKIKPSNVSEWLNKTDTYSLHKPVRKNFPRRKYIVGGINNLWQLDLSDLPQLAKYNDGFRYILLTIDVFTRKAYARPLKTKSGKEVSQAFQDILKSNNIKIEKIMTDRGKEFFNKDFKSVLNEYKIYHYVSNNQEIKASLVERLQRTIKSKLFRYFTHSNTYRYLDVLQDIILSYNETVHSSHDMKPNQINYDNQEEVWQRLYNQDNLSTRAINKFNIGDKVRISKYSTIFEKGYLPAWSEEVFTVSRIHDTTPIVYSLKDAASDELEGTWYEPELQKVNIEDNIYKIESIVGQRKVNGKSQYLVKWVGYPPSFNSYIDKKDLILNYKN